MPFQGPQRPLKGPGVCPGSQCAPSPELPSLDAVFPQAPSRPPLWQLPPSGAPFQHLNSAVPALLYPGLSSSEAARVTLYPLLILLSPSSSSQGCGTGMC